MEVDDMDINMYRLGEMEEEYKDSGNGNKE
jgi:hypothetical protein